MNDIDQLRADIATLEAATKVDCNEGLSTLLWCEIDKLSAKLKTMEELAKLEAEAAATKEAERVDKWADAKFVVSFVERHPNIRPWALHSESASVIPPYVRHLEQRIAELEAELAKRPVVWCLKRIDTGDYVRLGNNTIALWTSEGADKYDESANIQLDRIQLSKFEPYTGEQK